jgi:hypothetical protein
MPDAEERGTGSELEEQVSESIGWGTAFSDLWKSGFDILMSGEPQLLPSSNE